MGTTESIKRQHNGQVTGGLKQAEAVEVKPLARRRGRPPDPAVRQAILSAARAILDESGVAGVTMEAVAARAGVGKPTVYRWWPDRHSVAMAALMDAPRPEQALAKRVAPLHGLRNQLVSTIETLSSRTGRQVAMMIAASDPQTELSKAFRNHFILARREEGRAFLNQAIECGELRASIDVNLALDEIYGAIFFRLLLGHEPLDEVFVKRLLKQVVSGLTAARS